MSETNTGTSPLTECEVCGMPLDEDTDRFGPEEV